jgi:hypothetical protein
MSNKPKNKSKEFNSILFKIKRFIWILKFGLWNFPEGGLSYNAKLCYYPKYQKYRNSN